MKLLLLLCLAAGPVAAQDFAARAEALLSTGAFAGAQVAAVFVAAEDGAVAYARNADLPLVPASTAKLATSAAALERLTAEYRFTTTLLAAKEELGRKKLSVLVWRGNGDPSVSGRDRASMTEIYEVWADSLAALGVAKVGRLVLDNRYFEGPEVPPSWPPGELAYWYQAETSPISFNDNCVDLEFVPAARPGRRPKIALTPDIGYLRVRNKAVTGAPDSPFTLDFHRARGTNTVTFTGSIPAGRSRKDWVAVHAPARFAAEALKSVLKKKGIKVGGIVAWEKAGLKEEDLAPALAWRSQPLAQLIKAVNTNSQNFYAEQILKALGKEAAGRATFTDGAAEVSAYLGRIGLKDGQYYLVDGSGLSKENRFTAAGLVKVLAHMQGTPLFPVYYESLATAKNRMKGDPLAAGMRLKRGTVGNARNLAGYLHSASGKLYAFAVLVNAPALDRAAVDDGIDALCLAAARQLP
ncbi:MAG: D-alanyl-D-alanine carboxypeptidase/D-alanyl-D-alanine-endopeptidase [Elusimicrobia bacterium GWC2_61_19]|nr:MAG: D-alanyl-D-alanine carboxypeptidase/D-alanyl-D-alanine-endopeptidase [Elusimicrobia bacterium GWC2_61_19]